MTDIEKELGMTFLEIYEIQKKLNEGTNVYEPYNNSISGCSKEDTRDYNDIYVDFKEKEFVLLYYEPMHFYKFEDYKKTWFLEDDLKFNIDELYAVHSSLTMTINDCVIREDLEYLNKLKDALVIIIAGFQKTGYTIDLGVKYMCVKRQLLKLNAI